MSRKLPLLISHLLFSDEGYGFGWSPDLLFLLRELQAPFKTPLESLALCQWHGFAEISVGLARLLSEVSGCIKVVFLFFFCFFSLRRSLELCPEIRTGIKEIVLEIKNELERKEAWILNPLIQFRQRQEAPEDINPQHRTLPEIP